MLKLFKKFWSLVSNLGLDDDRSISYRDRKKLVFFNQLMFIGFFATAFQVVIAWPFIGLYSLSFLIISAASGVSLLLNYHGKLWISKRFFVFTLYGVAIWTSILLGGAGLYHLGAFSSFAATLIVFDFRKEKFEIIACIPLVVLLLAIGEYGLFNAADFSNHPWLQFTRIANLFNVAAINSILILFIIRLNDTREIYLEENKSDLQKQVEARTLELSAQKDALTRQNKEKEILLKEVHHRVKNNLQIIVSLINLQLSHLDADIVENALNETKSRVLSMSLVHRKMYQTANFVEVGLREYLLQMIDNVGELYGELEFLYEVNVDPAQRFDMETAIPLGLIFNEIITNFYKYATDPETSSEIPKFTIELYTEDDSTILLKYHDNGPGFDAKIDLQDSNTLGLQLTESLSQQIGATSKCYSDNGAVYELRLQG